MTPAQEDEFTAFVQSRGDALLRYARLLVPRDHEAEDVMQTALLRLTRHWSRGLASPEAYVRRTMLNVVRDRSRRRHLVAIPVAGNPERLDQSSDPATDLTTDADVQRLLAAVPPRQRAAVVLRVLEGFSAAEAAAAMGCSEATVNSNLSRGLAKLRVLLAGNDVLTEEVTR